MNSPVCYSPHLNDMVFIIIGLLAVTANSIHGNVVPIESGVQTGFVDNNKVNIKDALYQVSVMHGDELICAGNIISKRVVLTHNFRLFYTLNASSFSIQYGYSEFGGSDNVIPVQRIELYTHAYVSPFHYEPCLLLLEHEIPFSAVAQPISVSSTVATVDTYANVTGWGRFHEFAKYLHQDTVQIADRSDCKRLYPKFITVNENLLCAVVRRNGTDICAYDFGSSLVSNGELIGSSVVGIGCPLRYYHGLFINIAVYNNWIVSYANEN